MTNNDHVKNELMAIDGALPQEDASKALEARELTDQNRVFLEHVSNGVSTLEAYRLSGYKGSNHAAYQLRSNLKEELIRYLEAKGIDRAGLMLEVGRLIALPIKESEISIKQKLTALTLLHKMVEASKPQDTSKPKITAFIVNNTVAQPAKPDVIDGTLAE